jgi:hypothetical protein
VGVVGGAIAGAVGCAEGCGAGLAGLAAAGAGTAPRPCGITRTSCCEVAQVGTQLSFLEAAGCAETGARLATRMAINSDALRSARVFIVVGS